MRYKAKKTRLNKNGIKFQHMTRYVGTGTRNMYVAVPQANIDLQSRAVRLNK